MGISWVRARRLLSGPELDLVNASRASELKGLSPARLEQMIARARRLRDKYRDLSKRQRGEARRKLEPRSTRAAQTNENTVFKAEIFTEVLDRLSAQQVSAAGRPAKGGATKPAVKKSAAKKSAVKESAVTKRAVKKSAVKKSAVKKGAAKKASSKGAPKKDASIASRDASSQAASRGARAPFKQDRMQRAGTKLKQGHARGRTRRSQVRRDTRK